MEQIDINKSLSELCETSFEVPKHIHVTGLMLKVEEISRKKIKELSLSEIQTALSQSMCLNFLIPFVLPILKENPAAEGIFSGGILHSLLKSFIKKNNEDFWITNKNLKFKVIEFLMENRVIERSINLDIDSETLKEIKDMFDIVKG